MNNLRQIAISCFMYATDEGNRFPWDAEPSATGVFAGSPGDCYDPLRPYLGGNGRVFVCPTDSKRCQTTNALQSTNLSYFINLSSRPTGTNQVLAGDRHLSTNGVAVGPGRIVVAPTLSLNWTRELHQAAGRKRLGMVAFVDGHAKGFANDSKTREAFDRNGLSEQTLVVP